MAEKKERFELRLNAETLARLDRWAEQNDISTKSEAARSLIESGLASSNKQQFTMMQFQILNAALHSDTEHAISNACVFAWQSQVYPFHDHVQEHWAKPFAAHFQVSPTMIQELAQFLDELWLSRKSITFYELEDHYQIRQSRTKWDRTKLINSCRYMFLRNMFDESFWNSLLKPTEHPTEATYITASFDREEDIHLG